MFRFLASLRVCKQGDSIDEGDDAIAVSDRLGAERFEEGVGRRAQGRRSRVAAAGQQHREPELRLGRVATVAGLRLPQPDRPRQRGLGLGLAAASQRQQTQRPVRVGGVLRRVLAERRGCRSAASRCARAAGRRRGTPAPRRALLCAPRASRRTARGPRSRACASPPTSEASGPTPASSGSSLPPSAKRPPAPGRRDLHARRTGASIARPVWVVRHAPRGGQAPAFAPAPAARARSG